MNEKRISKKLRKQKEITIKYSNRGDAILYTDVATPGTEVCDILLSALCLALRATAENTGIDLEIYKQVSINEIKKIK